MPDEIKLSIYDFTETLPVSKRSKLAGQIIQFVSHNYFSERQIQPHDGRDISDQLLKKGEEAPTLRVYSSPDVGVCVSCEG